jgi:signal transduction histidine kinase
MPEWELAVELEGANPVAAATARRTAVYLWTGGAGIALIGVLALAVGGYVGRQMRLTRLKNDLIATVSHELKTPLASMRVLVDTLLEGRRVDPQQTREYLSLISTENERLSRLIDNFLTFSRMERNKQSFQFEAVDMGEVVRLAVSAMGERVTLPQCQLEVEVGESVPTVRGDRDALETVVLNLLDNACKYTAEEKRIGVRVLGAEGGVCVEVRDNGIGMTRRVMRRIFDRFYQVDQTLARRAGGCGLGLSIVKFIVEAHGGTIRVESEVGKGSRFVVRLPMAGVVNSS